MTLIQSATYLKDGTGTITFKILNMREDYSFKFFTGGFSTPTLRASSNVVLNLGPILSLTSSR